MKQQSNIIEIYFENVRYIALTQCQYFNVMCSLDPRNGLVAIFRQLSTKRRRKDIKHLREK